jgi:glycosyltransferase involved in cell wall biosynthesis
MRFSIVIPTFNRSSDLRQTLQSVAGLSTQQSWDVFVIDNNSTDDTPAVVSELARDFPVPLHYVFEKEQGRCAALNAGIVSSCGEIIATIDDDMDIDRDWLDQAEQALERLACDYVGSRVLPIWKGPRPSWLPNRGGRHWSVIGLVDYGPDAIEFSSRVLPSGIMAFRREVFSRAGLWDNSVGRRAGTLLGQEVRAWSWRARDAGLKGFYVPQMVVHHRVTTERLSKNYFRRWFYWHGVSRALLYEQFEIDMEAPEETALDFSQVPHIAGVPRYMYSTFLHSFGNTLTAFMKRDAIAAFEHELWLWFFAGIVQQRWKDRRAARFADTKIRKTKETGDGLSM